MCNDVVYVVDDSELVCFTHHKLIEKVYGKSVIKKFLEPEEALSALMEDLGQNLNILLFLDIQMPSMTGPEMIRKLENCHLLAHSKLSVVLVSSGIEDFSNLNIKDSHMIKGKIQKPLTNEKLEKFAKGHYENTALDVVA